MEITLLQLKNLLDEQKRITTEHLRGRSHAYNKDSNDNHSKPLPIDEEKMKQVGFSSQYPEDFNILKRYLKD